jgi:hypothetical protein
MPDNTSDPPVVKTGNHWKLISSALLIEGNADVEPLGTVTELAC